MFTGYILLNTFVIEQVYTPTVPRDNVSTAETTAETADTLQDTSQQDIEKEPAEFMKKLGAETAYNLDGGGSATMYFNG